MTVLNNRSKIDYVANKIQQEMQQILVIYSNEREGVVQSSRTRSGLLQVDLVVQNINIQYDLDTIASTGNATDFGDLIQV